MNEITMLKRPLNPRFREPVLAGTKTTTIRDKAWPVGVPIMLYNWSGAAYRSKQIDVAPVVVKGFWTIRITHLHRGDVMVYQCGKESGPALYKSEGFASQEEMDAWFRPLVKPGTTIEKTLMHFAMVPVVTLNVEPTYSKETMSALRQMAERAVETCR